MREGEVSGLMSRRQCRDAMQARDNRDGKAAEAEDNHASGGRPIDLDWMMY